MTDKKTTKSVFVVDGFMKAPLKSTGTARPAPTPAPTSTPEKGDKSK